jgi:hypothetical protein
MARLSIPHPPDSRGPAPAPAREDTPSTLSDQYHAGRAEPDEARADARLPLIVFLVVTLVA